MPTHWTPDFRIEADSVDVTARLRDRLISLEITDEAEDKSDRLALVLDDRPYPDGTVAALPAIATRLTVSIGYRETGLVRMGIYEVDDRELSAPPAVLDIGATAAALAGPIRARRTRSWHRQTLGDIARTVAAGHELEARVDADLDALPIAHADQQAESDLAFLNRLARDHDAVARPLGDYLVLARRGNASAVTGEPLAGTALAPGDVDTWSYSHAARREKGSAEGSGGGVRAWWWDDEAGERRSVDRGREPFEDIATLHESEAAARAAVASQSNSAARSKSELSLSMAGRPEIQAEARLTLTGWRPGVPLRWRITRVNHRIGSDGYTTEIAAEEQPEQGNVAALVRSAPTGPADAL
ncbi:contractile injection system protein, VgrG/Pvc8 family [Fodinicurvata sp. EGI_FJ10296]|uniref:contractile injection system protein, VgrG/Pvc8 family n=1 Tax=Fodinicurvata sp. EGI_FJ10296 TaxID=3231908 RepID=UPI003456BAA6